MGSSPHVPFLFKKNIRFLDQLLPHSPSFLSGKSPWKRQLCSLSEVPHFILHQACTFSISERLLLSTSLRSGVIKRLCPDHLLPKVWVKPDTADYFLTYFSLAFPDKPDFPFTSLGHFFLFSIVIPLHRLTSQFWSDPRLGPQTSLPFSLYFLWNLIHSCDFNTIHMLKSPWIYITFWIPPLNLKLKYLTLNAYLFSQN